MVNSHPEKQIIFSLRRNRFGWRAFSIEYCYYDSKLLSIREANPSSQCTRGSRPVEAVLTLCSHIFTIKNNILSYADKNIRTVHSDTHFFFISWSSVNFQHNIQTEQFIFVLLIENSHELQRSFKSKHRIPRWILIATTAQPNPRTDSILPKIHSILVTTHTIAITFIIQP